MCFSPFLWPKTFSQAAREPHVGASDYPRRVAPYFHFAMTDRYARPSAFAEAGPPPQSRRSVHRLPPQGPWTRAALGLIRGLTKASRLRAAFLVERTGRMTG
jgi:hypothetical protein